MLHIYIGRNIIYCMPVILCEERCRQVGRYNWINLNIILRPKTVKLEEDSSLLLDETQKTENQEPREKLTITTMTQRRQSQQQQQPQYHHHHHHSKKKSRIFSQHQCHIVLGGKKILTQWTRYIESRVYNRQLFDTEVQFCRRERKKRKNPQETERMAASQTRSNERVYQQKGPSSVCSIHYYYHPTTLIRMLWMVVVLRNTSTVTRAQQQDVVEARGKEKTTVTPSSGPMTAARTEHKPRTERSSSSAERVYAERMRTQIQITITRYQIGKVRAMTITITITMTKLYHPWQKKTVVHYRLRHSLWLIHQGC